MRIRSISIIVLLIEIVLILFSLLLLLVDIISIIILIIIIIIFIIITTLLLLHYYYYIMIISIEIIISLWCQLPSCIGALRSRASRAPASLEPSSCTGTKGGRSPFAGARVCKESSMLVVIVSGFAHVRVQHRSKMPDWWQCPYGFVDAGGPSWLVLLQYYYYIMIDIIITTLLLSLQYYYYIIITTWLWWWIYYVRIM